MPDTVQMPVIGPKLLESAQERNDQAIYDTLVEELGCDPLSEPTE